MRGSACCARDSGTQGRTKEASLHIANQQSVQLAGFGRISLPMHAGQNFAERTFLCRLSLTGTGVGSAGAALAFFPVVAASLVALAAFLAFLPGWRGGVWEAAAGVLADAARALTRRWRMPFCFCRSVLCICPISPPEAFWQFGTQSPPLTCQHTSY